MLRGGEIACVCWTRCKITLESLDCGRAASSYQCAFPYSDYLPALGPEFAGHPAITFPVRQDLLFPKSAPCGRWLVMAWASVPEATVYKDCNFQSWKSKVWFPGQLCVSSPTGEFLLPKNLEKSNFGLLVSA